NQLSYNRNQLSYNRNQLSYNRNQLSYNTKPTKLQQEPTKLQQEEQTRSPFESEARSPCPASESPTDGQATTLMPTAAARSLATESTCWASSLVGTSTKQMGPSPLRNSGWSRMCTRAGRRKLAVFPLPICILKDYLVVLDNNFENLFIFNRKSMQLESQIGTGICDMTVFIFSVSENESNIMVLVSGSLVQLLNIENIHMESVNNVFDYSFVEMKCRRGSIASLWTDRCVTSYLVLWLSCKDNPLIYELCDENSPKIVFDRLEWVTADRILLVRAASVPVCFSVFSLVSRSFLNHVVMNIGRGPQHFAISGNNKKLVMCQDGNFIMYDTASLKRVLCCKCDLTDDSMDFIGIFENNFMTVGQLSDSKVIRYYINEEYCSIDRVNEGKVSFESYDRFKSVQVIGDELMVVRCSSRDQRSAVLGLINHFDGNVFQFLKLRLGDMLSLTQNCLTTCGLGLKQKLSEIKKHKKTLDEYKLSKQRHVQQLMKAKMLELNRSHLNELKRIAKQPVYMSKAAMQDEVHAPNSVLFSAETTTFSPFRLFFVLAIRIIRLHKKRACCGCPSGNSFLGFYTVVPSGLTGRSHASYRLTRYCHRGGQSGLCNLGRIWKLTRKDGEQSECWKQVVLFEQLRTTSGGRLQQFYVCYRRAEPLEAWLTREKVRCFTNFAVQQLLFEEYNLLPTFRLLAIFPHGEADCRSWLWVSKIFFFSSSLNVASESGHDCTRKTARSLANTRSRICICCGFETRKDGEQSECWKQVVLFEQLRTTSGGRLQQFYVCYRRAEPLEAWLTREKVRCFTNFAVQQLLFEEYNLLPTFRLLAIFPQP
uniref:CNH domain-containing protein n=1 Tax=Macrostomum lignano TaxID=282301 RepID=A0A1I8JJ32_9PLAT